MFLTPEEKSVGQENFKAAIGSSLIRRGFLEKGIREGIRSGKGLGPYYFKYGKSVDKPVRVGMLGTGDEGSVLIGAINPSFIQVTAIADIRPYNVHRAFHGDHSSGGALKARCGLMTKYGWKTEEEARKNVKVHGGYHELLENEPDVEAVIIALPLHLHAEASIAAMKAGKHVLTEKLMAHNVHECKEMARVANETDLLLATGHQRHYNILYDNAVELISRGVLGDLHYIRAQWHRGNMPGTDSWQQPLPKKAKPNDLLANQLIDQLQALKEALKKAEHEKDKKNIPALRNKIAQKKAQMADEVLKDTAKDFGYQEKIIKDGQGKVLYERPPIEELIRWRLWDRTGGGLMAELGSHQLDAASIFIAAVHGGKKQHPLNVSASSGRPIFPADRDVDDHVYCVFEFPAPDYDPKDKIMSRKRISVAYASINGNGFGGYGETVFGTKGTLLLEREKEAMLYRTSATSQKIKLDRSRDKKDPAAVIKPEDKGDPLSTAIATQALHGDISRGYAEELEHWAWCIRNRDPENQPRCHPEVALADAVIALTTNIAAAKGQRIEFKKEWFDPRRDETPEGVKPDVSRYA